MSAAAIAIADMAGSAVVARSKDPAFSFPVALARRQKKIKSNFNMSEVDLKLRAQSGGYCVSWCIRCACLGVHSGTFCSQSGLARASLELGVLLKKKQFLIQECG